MKVLVVGGGAAGLMAAGAAVREGHQVTVLEHMDKPARRSLVTGKGRCNVTNDCTAEEFLHHVRTNPAFCDSSLGAFPPAKTMELFEGLGVELKVERGRRVFPVSDKAEEIRQALLRYAQDAGACARRCQKAAAGRTAAGSRKKLPAVPENPRHPKKKRPARPCGASVCGAPSGREYRADAVLVATGGVSYPTTGSTGDGYQAGPAGRATPSWSRCPVWSALSAMTRTAKKMMGLALKNVTLTLFEDGKDIFEEQGEMLFTHLRHPRAADPQRVEPSGRHEKHKYHAEIDLKPALSESSFTTASPGIFSLLANHAAQGALVKLFAVQYAAGDGGALGHRPGHQGKPDHPGAEEGAGAADEALAGVH